MSSLAFDNVGQNLPYSSIASALQIEESEVERWAIDAVRAGLVGGRLSQTHRTLHISRATPRSFGDSQWNLLEQRLLAWQTGLASVMDVILATQTSGRPAAVANAKEATAA
jgi:translation initiation factor 3 subunit M